MLAAPRCVLCTLRRSYFRAMLRSFFLADIRWQEKNRLELRTLTQICFATPLTRSSGDLCQKSMPKLRLKLRREASQIHRREGVVARRVRSKKIHVWLLS